MKTLLIFLSIACSLNVFAQQEIDVTINGKTYPVYEGQEFGYITEKGEKVIFEFAIKENNVVPTKTAQTTSSFSKNQQFNDKLLKFEYPEQHSIAIKRLSQNVRQITMVNGEGGGIVIQEFMTLNPETIADDFLFELLNGQAPTNVENVTIQSNNNKKLKGKSVTDFDGTEIQVFAYGSHNKGLLIALIGDDTKKTLTNIVKTFTVK